MSKDNQKFVCVSDTTKAILVLCASSREAALPHVPEGYRMLSDDEARPMLDNSSAEHQHTDPVIVIAKGEWPALRDAAQ